MKTWDDYENTIKQAYSKEEFSELTFVNNIISDLIKYRLDRGLTQAELAKKAGLKQSAIARLESGDVIPRLDTIFKIAKALNINFSLLDQTLIRDVQYDSRESGEIDQLKFNIAQLKDDVKELLNQVHYLTEQQDQLKRSRNSEIEPTDILAELTKHLYGISFNSYASTWNYVNRPTLGIQSRLKSYPNFEGGNIPIGYNPYDYEE